MVAGRGRAEGRNATGILWREARHCPQHPILPRAVPTTKNHPPQNVLSAGAEMPCSHPMWPSSDSLELLPWGN